MVQQVMFEIRSLQYFVIFRPNRNSKLDTRSHDYPKEDVKTWYAIALHL